MDFKKISNGDVLSTTMYVTVVSKDKDGIKVKDTNGAEFVIKGPKLIDSTMNSASQYIKEEKVSRTKAIETLVGAKDTVFSAQYTKQDGTERTMIGHLIETENLLGRSMVFDLEEKDPKKSPIKQVDHRTLKWVILKGVKSSVK